MRLIPQMLGKQRARSSLEVRSAATNGNRDQTGSSKKETGKITPVLPPPALQNPDLPCSLLADSGRERLTNLKCDLQNPRYRIVDWGYMKERLPVLPSLQFISMK